MTLAAIRQAGDFCGCEAQPSVTCHSSLLCVPPCLVEAIITPLELEADGLLGFKLVLHGVPCKHGRWNRSGIENAGYFVGYQ